VERCGNSVHDPILSEQGIHGPVIKTGALITNDGSRDYKSAKYIRSNKIHNNLSIVSSGGFGFHPFRNIIKSKENINKNKRDRERPHKINTPNIKHLSKQHGLLRHLLSP